MILDTIRKGKSVGKKQLAVLLDPDKLNPKKLSKAIEQIAIAQADYIFVGGSLMSSVNIDVHISQIKAECNLPVIIFPGSPVQICSHADAILLLSLISGRNPELLIGQHVVAASRLKSSKLEIMPCGYLLIDGGRPTSVTYMSQTSPIPHDKPDIAANTALAGEMLGLDLIYMDAGSGAKQHISKEMISAVQEEINVPLMIGGGISTPEVAADVCKAGADVIVIGTAGEENPEIIVEISDAIKEKVNEDYNTI